MICENCENNHKGDYGSGRFCCSRCARGFSTKEKRKEINEKVSVQLSGRKTGRKQGHVFTKSDRIKARTSKIKIKSNT